MTPVNEPGPTPGSETPDGVVERQLLHIDGHAYGPTDDDEVWNALADLMLSPIAGLQIERVFVDSGFRPNKPDAGDEHKVYEFTRRYPWLVSPTKGRSTMSPPYRVSKIEVTVKGKKASYSIDLVWLSTDFFKSLLVSRIRTPLDQPGSFIVPDDIDEDYAKQLVSEVRVVDGATGTSANGGLARITDTVVEITIPAAATANLPPGSVVMDMVRTDLEPDRHLNFTLEIPVVRPVTRGL